MAERNTNYVKFKRGTPSAYAALEAPDSDTLYFIYEEDENYGDLYLGTKLISSADNGNGTSGVSYLSALEDVLLSSNLNQYDGLIYDINQSKWINKPIIEILTAFVGTNGISAGSKGLVPAPTADEANMFLRSDGTWSEIVTASNVQVFQTIVEMGETQEDAITRITQNNTITNGDIVVVKELIIDDLYQHTSYIFANNKWIAMDGNYSVENVYLANDLTITADIGVQKLNGAGSKILDTAGKNLKQVLDMLLTERRLPTRANPVVSVTSSQAKAYEVGTFVTPSYSASLTPGSYTYGPDTGVTATAWSATFNDETIKSQIGTFKPVVVTDGFNQKISVTVTHTRGEPPLDNLGNPITDNAELLNTQIQSGDKTASTTNAISSYRNSFYGSKIEAVPLNSNNIRALSAEKSTNNSLTIPIVEGATQVIIAIPVGRKVTKIADEGAFGTNIFSEFKKTIVSVDGASTGYEKDYNVYTYSPTAALGANTYTVTVTNE